MNKIFYDERIGLINQMSFLTGEISINNTPGVKIIASGCGSGKTTIIKRMIRSLNSDGILYAASTIKECDEMYDWIVKNAVGLEDAFGNILKLEDIASIHNSPRCDESGRINNGVDLDTWNKNPYEFKNKKIIICTHHKLFHEYPELLIGYNLNRMCPEFLNVYDRVWTSNSSMVPLPRKYIFIDELPRCGVLKKSITKTELGLLGMTVSNVRYDRQGNGSIIDSYTRYENYMIAKDVYTRMEKVDKNLQITVSTSEPAELRRDLIISNIHKNYYKYIKSNNDPISISCNLLSLDNGYSRILLFEGTGDILYSNSDLIEVYTTEEKYNSPIDINKIPISISRRIDSIKSEEDKIQIFSRINNTLDNMILSVFQRSDIDKVLIVTWKNLKNNSDTDESNSVFNTEINENFSFTEYIRDYLLGRTNKEFSIIHYQSGLDRATNEFMDYDSIVFLGEFHVPNSAVIEINQDLGSNCSPKNFLLHQLVQAVCRTRIRKHNKEEIHIFFTDDWSPSIINDLNNYLLDKSSDNSSYIGDLNIRDKWKNQIQILSNYDNNISLSIRQGLKYSFNIGLDEIYEMIPFKERQIRSYYPLINYLRKLGIEMNITTISNNKGRLNIL